jgi:hypothetical protein
MIRRTWRIGWEICPGAAEAVAREGVLLRQYRPPFNRAGVWVPPDCGLRLGLAEGRLEMELLPTFKAPGAGETALIGPLPGRFRRAFVPLARSLFRAMHPRAGWWEYPSGLLLAKPVPAVGWDLPEHYETPLAEMLSLLETGESNCPWLMGTPDSAPDDTGHDAGFWKAQREAIAAFQRALKIHLA